MCRHTQKRISHTQRTTHVVLATNDTLLHLLKGTLSTGILRIFLYMQLRLQLLWSFKVRLTAYTDRFHHEVHARLHLRWPRVLQSSDNRILYGSAELCLGYVSMTWITGNLYALVLSPLWGSKLVWRASSPWRNTVSPWSYPTVASRADHRHRRGSGQL